MGCSKSSYKREFYNDIRLPQEKRKISNKPNLPSKCTRKRRTNKTKPKVSRRKEIINIRDEINKTEDTPPPKK